MSVAGKPPANSDRGFVSDVVCRVSLLQKTHPLIRSWDLVRELEWLFLVHGRTKKPRFDNRSEYRSKRFVVFLAESSAKAGSPWQNGHIESFFGKLRDELLSC